jgi:putative transposase
MRCRRSYVLLGPAVSSRKAHRRRTPRQQWYSTSRCTWLSSPSISTSVARVGADVGEDGAQDVDSLSVEHTAAIFWYEDQLHAQGETLTSLQFELRPNGAQRQQMRCFAGSCRFVYNKGLALQKARFDVGENKLSYAGLCKLLTQWRSETETSWQKDAPTHPLQQALKDLERAYTTA